MPTVKYTNDPNAAGQEGSIYAPNLPWWVQQEQPIDYAALAPGFTSPEAEAARVPESYGVSLGATSSTVSPTAVSMPSRGTDIISNLDVPLYGGAQADEKYVSPYSARYGQPSGGGAGAYRPPTGSKTVSTSKTVFKGERPTLELPEYDKSRVRSLQQEAAAPGVRRLRTALNRALVRSYENPNVARMITRSALSGYGEGLESVLAGAGGQARAEYAQERSSKERELMANYNAALQEYVGSAEQVTTQTTQGTYGSENLSPADKEQAYREKQLAYTRVATGGRTI